MRINCKVNYENFDLWWWGYVVSGGIFFMWIFKKNCYIVILILNIELFLFFYNFLEIDGWRVIFFCIKEYIYVLVFEFIYIVVIWFINSIIVVVVEFF